MFLLLLQLLCCLSITYMLFAQLFAIHICRRMVFRGRQMTGTDLPPSHVRIVTGHWTAAASPDILDEVSNMIQENQLLAAVVSGMTTVVITVAQVRMRVLEWQTGAASDRFTAMCCAEGTAEWHADQCSNGCKWGVLGHAPCLTFILGLMVFFVCSTAFIPSNLWSPLTVKAVNKRCRPHMRRMLRVPMVTGVLWAIDAFLFFIYIASQFEWSVPDLWTGVFVCDIAAALTHGGVMLWAIGWQSFAAMPRSMWRFAANIYGATFPGDQMSNKRAGLGSWVGSRHARRYTQLVLGAGGMFTFAVDALGTGHRLATLELWIVRILILILMVLFSRDVEADFDMLEKGQGAGFGLLLDAWQLRKSLKCHLAGQQYLGRVKRYKGTILRMCDTMTISYRWQGSIVQIEGLGTVNMSNWQMESLVEAIRSSGCLYVWLDAFSVPQLGNGELKKVLLSRMMSVYASSFVTAVLLSCEEESGRYHQVRAAAAAGRVKNVGLDHQKARLRMMTGLRTPASQESNSGEAGETADAGRTGCYGAALADPPSDLRLFGCVQRVWTLQEYCSSRQLMVYEEERAEGHRSTCGGKTAVEEGEAKMAKQLRREHTARQPWCEPVWINSSIVASMQEMPAEDSQHIWETYKDLRRSLFCKCPEDTIRAL